MRGIEEFTKELAQRVQAKLSGVEVTPMEILRTNSEALHGLMFRREGENVAPTLYVERWFELFMQNSLSADAILEQIIRTYQELPEPNIPDMEEYLSSPELINRISVRLLNLEKNRQLIEERRLVHYVVPNTDLVVLFYIMVISDGDASGDIALSEIMMERYLPTFKNAQDLYNEVINNVSLETVKFESLLQLANGILEEQGVNIPFLLEEPPFLYVLTNTQKMFGAAVLLSKAGQKCILEKFPNGKITVLPSSVHETLLLETTEDECVMRLQKMVKEVNRTQLDYCDFLSDNVYHLDANTGELVIASVDESEVEEE